MKTTWLLVLSFALAPLHAGARPAETAEGIDGRWVPWLGCWEAQRPTRGQEGARVCIVADDRTSVKVLTIAAGEVLSEQVIRADGAAHPAMDQKCRGTEVAQWATARPGLYRRAEFSCGGEDTRAVNGLWFVGPRRTWVEVIVRDMSGATSVRVRRYRPSAEQGLPDGVAAVLPDEGAWLAALEEAGVPWTVPAVIEASGRLPPDGVQAAISEAGEGFALDARSLLAMSDAGVDASVIDLMVALSYPRRFEVRRASGGFGGWPGVDDWFFAPAWSMIFGAGAFGFASDYWQECSGFYAWWCYPYYGGGGWVPVHPGEPGSGGGPATPTTRGKVVKGFGYTQVTVRDSSPGGTGGASGSGGAGSSGNSSGGQASPQGYSGGASGGGSPRTAQPRGPGG